MDADIERIRSALFYLSADMPRNEWVEIAMALKSELGEDGFELFNKWSEKSDKYNARDIRDTWRSCTPDGGITIATLFFRAKQAGWRNDGTRPTKEELAAQRRRSTERAAKEKAERARKQAEAAKKAAQIWKAAKSALDNPYLIRKSISPVETLRQIPDNEAMEILGYAPASDGNTLTGSLLVAPIYVEGLASVEFVDEGGRKSALAGGKKSGGFWPAQLLPDGDGTGLTLLIGEGVATTLTAREATGYPAIATLTCNFRPVATAMRERFPLARLVILADLGNGQKDAEETARASAPHWSCPISARSRMVLRTSMTWRRSGVERRSPSAFAGRHPRPPLPKS